nr:bifunctional diguanylate cyclase/phosphodiesterase [Paraglaciecola sp. G1-23]
MSDELIQIYNNLPQDIGILSSKNKLIYTNSSWIQNLKKCASENIYSEINAEWPNPLLQLNDKQLDHSLRLAIHKAQSAHQPTSEIHTDISLLGYQHKVNFFISPIKFNGIGFTLISIQISMDPLSGGTQSILLGRDEGILLNSLLEGVVIQDANGVIIANNSASENILGLTSNQMRGLDNADPNWGTITEHGEPCPPEDHPSSQAISKGVPILDFTMGINKPDGGISWLKINSQPIFQKNQSKPTMSVTSFVDITVERHRQKQLTEVTKRLQLTLDAAEIGIWEYSLKTKQLVWDDTMFSIFETNKHDFTHQLTDFAEHVHPDDKQGILAEFKQALTEGNNLVSEFRIINNQKQIRHIYVAGSMIHGKKGEGNTYIGMNRDITDEKQVQEKIKESRNKLISFIADLPAGVCSVVNKKVSLNVRAEHITGYTNEQIADINDFWDKVFVDSRDTSPILYESLTQTRESISNTTMQINRRDGQTRWIEFSSCKFEDGQAWVMIDVTDKIEAENNLKQLAYFDPLTQLPNRTAIENNLINSIARAKRHASKLGLLVIDLDSFKNVNDTYGHPVGDQLLVLVAKRLKESLRESDFIGRIGGDEFMVVIEDIIDDEQLMYVSNELIKRFSVPIELVGKVTMPLKNSISIGACVYPEHGKDAVTLFRNADTALYKAKSRGKDRAQLYMHEFTLALESKLSLEQHIDNAIETNDFTVFFQPIVNCQDNQIVSVESLIRWSHPELGMIPPDRFIPVAEASGKIIKIGKWVLRKACEEFMAWQKRNIQLDYIAVNLSPMQFKDVSLLDDIQDILSATGLAPNNLVLEITEGVLVRNDSITKNTLLKLKALGIRLAIDDFGTGYSSLAYLKYFDVDILKIDRSFIKDIPDDSVDIQITGAIISMAKNLNLHVVAEGVETTDQLNFIQDNHCNTYQGYLKSPAISSADFVALFQTD